MELCSSLGGSHNCAKYKRVYSIHVWDVAAEWFPICPTSDLDPRSNLKILLYVYQSSIIGHNCAKYNRDYSMHMRELPAESFPMCLTSDFDPRSKFILNNMHEGPIIGHYYNKYTSKMNSLIHVWDLAAESFTCVKYAGMRFFLQ